MKTEFIDVSQHIGDCSVEKGGKLEGEIRTGEPAVFLSAILPLASLRM